MALSPSTRIGQYEIQALIGAGGMGEVYSALDTRLNRTVAVKVLPLALSNDSAYMQRFQREAQVLASLNHPHIAAIYGLEQNAIIMELVEGPTLAERTVLALDDALSIARQIAEALEYAHDKHVIHRDLKPGNVKITPSGDVKVLDFGLAKVAEPAPSVISANSPTLTMRATEAGVILGTASYMAPEQAAGTEVDKRADIWSFGVVLWEMLTGRRMFDGETVSHTLADVLRAPIDLDAIPPATPRAVRDLVRRCLERDPRKRLRDIGEARILLESPRTEERPAIVERKGLPYWAAAVCLLPAVGMGVLKWREQPPAAPVVRFTVDGPERGFADTRLGTSRISPDGTKVLLLDRGDSRGSGTLWIRRLDSTQLQPLAGTDGATYPFWSGDSRHVGFFADGKLKRVAMEGGPPVTVCAAPDGRGGAWYGGADGVIVFAPSNNGPLSFVAAAGGEPLAATALDETRKEVFHRLPHFLPDGNHFLYLAGAPGTASVESVFAGKLPSTGSKPAIGKLVVKTATEAMVAPSGHLLFIRENTLLAQPFDLKNLSPKGEPVPVAENVVTGGIRHTSGFSLSATGALTYRNGANANAPINAVWLDRGGKEIERGASNIGFSGVIRLSPDGKFLAGTKEDSSGVSDIWLFDLSRGSGSRFTFDARPEGNPVWSPDGKRIAYRAGSRGIRMEILVNNVGGVGEPASVLQSKTGAIPAGWSRDGKWLFYSESDTADQSKLALFAIGVDGGRKPVRLVAPQFVSTYPAPSPDGRYFAYVSNESGRSEVYVRTFSSESPNEGGKWQVSNGDTGSPIPQWRADGKEIYYVDANRRMIAVPVQISGSGFQAGKPAVLFETKGLTIPSGDGQRFLGLLPAGDVEKPVENIVLNWTALLGGRR